MSTPAQVPSIPIMFGDGPSADVRMVPMTDMHSAVQQGGGRIATKMVGPKGDTIWVPESDAQGAAQAGYQRYGAIQMRRPMDQTPSIGQQVDSGVVAFGNALRNAVPGLLHMFASPVQAGQQAAIQAMQNVGQQPTTGSKIAAAAAPFLNVDANAVQQGAVTAGKTGNYGPLVASAAIPLATAHLATSNVGPSVNAGDIINQVADVPQSRTLSPQEFASKITDAAQIPAKQMPTFEKNVAGQYQNILDATEGGTPGGVKNLADMVRATADARRANYYNNILQPYADIPRGTRQITNYQGETVAPNQATLGMLDERLSNINKELYGAYERGGGQAMATQAALSVGDKLSLAAEAQGIRQVLNSELAARNGMTVDQIAKMRSDFGQLGNIADKLDLAYNKYRGTQNAADNAPYTLETHPAALVMRGVQKAYRSVRGTPADAGIRDAFKPVYEYGK